MTMFEVYTKEVEINGEKYRLRPLSGRFIKPFFDVLKAFEEATKVTKGQEDFLSNLSTDAIEKAHMLALETFKKSYPQEDEAKLEDFVTQNLMSIIPMMAEVNLPNKA